MEIIKRAATKATNFESKPVELKTKLVIKIAINLRKFLRPIQTETYSQTDIFCYVVNLQICEVSDIKKLFKLEQKPCFKK